MRRRGGRWGIRIENVSGVPVYDVTLIFRPPSGDQPIIVKDATVIGPRDSKFVPVPHLPEGSRWGSLAHIQATLTFVEPSGRCWTRDHRGRLTEGPYIHPEQGPLVPWPEVPRV